MELPPPPGRIFEFTEIWRNWLNIVYEKLRGPLWYDNLTSLNTAKPGASAPTLRAFGPTGNNQLYDFAIGDILYTAGFHINHDIKPGSKIYPHVHWSTNGVNTNTVKWELSWTVAKGHQQEAFPADTVINLEAAASGTAWYHMITEATDTQTFDAPEVDSIVIMRIRRVTNGGTDNTDQVFGIFVDLHYQRDRFGTPQKSPNFYAR